MLEPQVDWSQVTIKFATLDGRKISYCSQTIFRVQIGKGKGSYRTRWEFIGDLNRAVLHYTALNIGNGYKKRLYAPGMNKPVLARAFS